MLNKHTKLLMLCLWLLLLIIAGCLNDVRGAGFCAVFLSVLELAALVYCYKTTRKYAADIAEVAAGLLAFVVGVSGFFIIKGLGLLMDISPEVVAIMDYPTIVLAIFAGMATGFWVNLLSILNCLVNIKKGIDVDCLDICQVTFGTAILAWTMWGGGKYYGVPGISEQTELFLVVIGVISLVIFILSLCCILLELKKSN